MTEPAPEPVADYAPGSVPDTTPESMPEPVLAQQATTEPAPESATETVTESAPSTVPGPELQPVPPSPAASPPPAPRPIPTPANLTERGVSLFNQGRFQEAIDQFTKAIALDPDYKEAWERRAEAYGRLGRPETAEGRPAAFGGLLGQPDQGMTKQRWGGFQTRPSFVWDGWPSRHYCLCGKLWVFGDRGSCLRRNDD